MTTEPTIQELFERARQLAEDRYQIGQSNALKRLDTPGVSTVLGDLILRADALINSLERDGGVAWTSRGYRDTLVEHRDSVGDV